MLRVDITQAKPGMTLALPVFHPLRHETALLADGMELDERSIRRLREIKVREVWIEYPEAAFVSRYINPSVIVEQARMTQTIAEAFTNVARHADAPLEYATYRAVIGSLLNKLVARPSAAVFLQELVDRDEPALQHASTTAFLCLLMGLKLEGYLITQRSRLNANRARDVSSLGVGGMLHDIGMLRLDPDVANRWYHTHDESDPEWRQHVRLGYKLVRGEIEPTAAAAVLNHHQRYDGSGFPKKHHLDGRIEPVEGDAIHIFVRVIAVADIFDRLRNPALDIAGDRPVPAVRALRRMREPDIARRIDPMVFKALLAVVPAYAPGTIVTLNNGVRGVVVEWFPYDPCRPTVQELGDIERDFDRAPEPKRQFVLLEDESLCVAEAEGQDVLADNFYPSEPGEFDLVAADKALFNAAADAVRDASAYRARSA
jgi:HD-GYP domain-containing protein (c-di-GMP phosphodiesterase class II)